jgi:hypothetical protein
VCFYCKILLGEGATEVVTSQTVGCPTSKQALPTF